MSTQPNFTAINKLNMEENMSENKERHGCLTVYLGVLILANILTTAVYIFNGDAILAQLPSAPSWALPILIVGGVVGVVCGIALFMWKKWGFYGFIALSVIIFIVNLMIGIDIVTAASGLLGVAILYGVLQIGERNKGWPQLE